MTQRWDSLLLDCRLATMSANGEPYGAIDRAALGWRDGRIAFAGPMDELPGAPETLARELRSAEGAWITPGLVDCHTHLVFGGDRAAEFEQRLGGASYEDIAKAGGGILSTVRATREADEDALFAQSLPRARRRRRHDDRDQVRLRPRSRQRASHAARRTSHRRGARHRRQHDAARRARVAAGVRRT
jgi:imidazolonepropionase